MSKDKVIYKVTNRYTKKVYIGLTTIPLNKRLYMHIWNATANRSNSKLSVAIRKYGKVAFRIVALESCKDDASLQKKEKSYIKKYNSIEKGYNCNCGGQLGRGSGQPITIRGKTFSSKKLACQHYGVSCTNFFARKSSGWSDEEALELKVREKPVFKGKQIKFKNKVFNSISELCKFYNVKQSLFRSRRANGCSVEEALDLVDVYLIHNRSQSIEYKGKTYSSRRKLAESLNINFQVFYNLFNKGQTIEQIINRNNKPRPGNSVNFNGKVYGSQKLLANELKINYPNLCYHLRTGKNLEESVKLLT